LKRRALRKAIPAWPSQAGSNQRIRVARGISYPKGCSSGSPLAVTQPDFLVHVVTAENRHFYERELEESFRLRHRVYAMEYGWGAFRRPDGRETDRYDCSEAIYLLALEEGTGRLIGGARLVPTIEGPTLSGLRGLTTFSVPRSPFIYHLSRIVVVPERREYPGLNLVASALLCAAQEYCLAEDIEQLTLLIRTSQLPQYLALGWNPQPLGLPVSLWGASLIPIIVDVSEAALNTTRTKRSIRGSVLVRRGITLPAVKVRSVGRLN